MSGDRTPAKIATASIPAPACEITDPICRAAQSHWRQERLIEARGILADMAHHPDTLVILACRVVCGCSCDARERADALGVMRLLSARPSERPSATPKGGVA
jgi:hypothetical protein